jgi:hypothetical protein
VYLAVAVAVAVHSSQRTLTKDYRVVEVAAAAAAAAAAEEWSEETKSEEIVMARM